MAFHSAERRREWFREKYAETLQWTRDLKVERGCADCGYDAHHSALEFDHLQPRLRGTVASLMHRSKKQIMEEIDRCEVVCANCHRIREFNRKVAASGTLLPSA